MAPGEGLVVNLDYITNRKLVHRSSGNLRTSVFFALTSRCLIA
jgi:hypothetical protein